MVVRDFNAHRIAIHPDEADSPLTVDPDAVLSAAIALQRFQSIGGWDPQIVQRPRVVQHAQFASCNLLDVLWQTLRTNSVPDLLCFPGTKVPDHGASITLGVI